MKDSHSRFDFSKINYSVEFRTKLNLKGASDRFQMILYKIIPYAIPMCYIERYESCRDEVKVSKRLESVKVVGSDVGWYFNERLKFLAAEATSKGVKLIDFQHGGAYGFSLILPIETISLEKDTFYTWGWELDDSNKAKSLPSPHLSKLKDTHSLKLDNILFVGVTMPRYHYRFHALLQPEDMLGYLKDKEMFFQALTDELRNKVLYRPYTKEYGWKEVDIVKRACPNARFIFGGKLTSWMQRVKLVVIDHAHTSFIEALTINVPCIFYWDNEVYLMRNKAEKYFSLLREQGILFNDPLSAAKKVKEIFNDPMRWWMKDSVQKARIEFCKQYAYARKDWMRLWRDELGHL